MAISRPFLLALLGAVLLGATLFAVQNARNSASDDAAPAAGELAQEAAVGGGVAVAPGRRDAEAEDDELHAAASRRTSPRSEVPSSTPGRGGRPTYTQKPDLVRAGDPNVAGAKVAEPRS